MKARRTSQLKIDTRHEQEMMTKMRCETLSLCGAYRLAWLHSITRHELQYVDTRKSHYRLTTLSYGLTPILGDKTRTQIFFYR